MIVDYDAIYTVDQAHESNFTVTWYKNVPFWSESETGKNHSHLRGCWLGKQKWI